MEFNAADFTVWLVVASTEGSVNFPSVPKRTGDSDALGRDGIFGCANAPAVPLNNLIPRTPIIKTSAYEKVTRTIFAISSFLFTDSHKIAVSQLKLLTSCFLFIGLSFRHRDVSQFSTHYQLTGRALARSVQDTSESGGGKMNNR